MLLQSRPMCCPPWREDCSPRDSQTVCRDLPCLLSSSKEKVRGGPIPAASAVNSGPGGEEGPPFPPDPCGAFFATPPRLQKPPSKLTGTSKTAGLPKLCRKWRPWRDSSFRLALSLRGSGAGLPLWAESRGRFPCYTLNLHKMNQLFSPHPGMVAVFWSILTPLHHGWKDPISVDICPETGRREE